MLAILRPRFETSVLYQDRHPAITAETRFFSRALYDRITLCNDILIRGSMMKHNLTIPCLKRDANDTTKRGCRLSSPHDLHAWFIDPPDNHTSLYKVIKIRLLFALLKITQGLSCHYSLIIQSANPRIVTHQAGRSPMHPVPHKLSEIVLVHMCVWSTGISQKNCFISLDDIGHKGIVCRPGQCGACCPPSPEKPHKYVWPARVPKASIGCSSLA